MYIAHYSSILWVRATAASITACVPILSEAPRSSAEGRVGAIPYVPGTYQRLFRMLPEFTRYTSPKVVVVRRNLETKTSSKPKASICHGSMLHASALTLVLLVYCSMRTADCLAARPDNRRSKSSGRNHMTCIRLVHTISKSLSRKKIAYLSPPKLS